MLLQENVTVLCILSVHILDVFPESFYGIPCSTICSAMHVQLAVLSVHLVATQGSFCTRFDLGGISDDRNWSLFGEVESARVFSTFFVDI